MRNLVLLSLLLCSCGQASDEQHADLPTDPAEAARVKADYERERARYAAIRYPACDDVRSDEKLSSCGRKVLATALTACQDTLGSGQAWIDQHTGDSWQLRAGYVARSIDDRLKDMDRGSGPNYSESFAYAKGNGTDEIGNVICLLSPEMRLTDVI